MYIIYKFTSPSNKSYIGVTTRSFKCRLLEHISGAYRGSNTWFHQAIRKYDIENFYIEILRDDITDKKVLAELETYYIDYYDTFNHGYNMDRGGCGINRFVRQETKDKLSAARSAYIANNIKKVKESAKKGAKNRDQKAINKAVSETKQKNNSGNNRASSSIVHIYNDKDELVYIKSKSENLEDLPDDMPYWRRVKYSYLHNGSKMSKPFSGWYAKKIKDNNECN